MGKLEKIIFMADYIEVNRDFDGVEALRQAAERDLDEAVLLATIRRSATFSIRRNRFSSVRSSTATPISAP